MSFVFGSQYRMVYRPNLDPRQFPVLEVLFVSYEEFQTCSLLEDYTIMAEYFQWSPVCDGFACCVYFISLVWVWCRQF